MKDKQRRSYSTWFPVEEFINRLILHISPKNFKVVRWYGLYSRREVRRSRIREIQETIFSVFEVKKKIIKCPKCKSPLKNVFCFINKPPDKRKLMNELNYWINGNS